MVMSGLLCFKLILRINSKRKPKTLLNNSSSSHDTGARAKIFSPDSDLPQ